MVRRLPMSKLDWESGKVVDGKRYGTDSIQSLGRRRRRRKKIN